MNKYNGLLSSVSHKYHIYKGTQETENDWKTRLIYSICGMMAYASLWDDSEEGSISITHLKEKSTIYLQITNQYTRNFQLTYHMFLKNSKMRLQINF